MNFYYKFIEILKNYVMNSKKIFYYGIIVQIIYAITKQIRQ